jgi:NAD(P)H dehydrogenase (quinone)
MYASPKSDLPIITPDKLAEYDAFIMGIPTRFGNFPAQWKVSIPFLSIHYIPKRWTLTNFQAFWDSTGQLWMGGKLAGKYAGVFVSTAGLGGGQESTVLATMSTLAHHGIIYVPFGFKHASAQLSKLDEVHGGTYLSAELVIVTLDRSLIFALLPTRISLGCWNILRW